MLRSVALCLLALAASPLARAAVPAPLVLEREGATVLVPAVGAPTAEERRVLETIARGDDSPESLKNALIAVSGVSDPAEVAKAEALVASKLALVAPAVRAQKDDYQKGKALLEALHRTVFTKYALDATYPVQTLETGLYNCVSSAVIYNAFAAALGLKTIGAVAPSHAYSFLLVGERKIDVQTTIAGGFDLHMSEEEHRAFLRRHGLDVTPGAETGPVSNARLDAIALENRLSLKHDGAMDTRASEDQLRTQIALAQRLALLVPASASYRRNLVGSWQQLATYLRTRGRADEAYAATIAALEQAGQSKDPAQLATARQNTVAYTFLAMRALAQKEPAAALGVLDRTRQLLGCPDQAECRSLDQGARGVLFDEAKARSDASDHKSAWEVADLVASKLPARDNAGNLVYFALREGQRRWDDGDRTGAERLASDVLGRIGCSAVISRDCTLVGGWMTGRWFETDTTKALSWARRTLLFSPGDEGARHNVRLALHVEVLRLAQARACPQAQSLAQELSESGAEDAEAQRAAASCH